LATLKRPPRPRPPWLRRARRAEMPLRVVRLGTPREPNEGVRIGTVRRPPRGVPKDEYAQRDFYDVWLPNLAPSAELFSSIKDGEITDARWAQFARKYKAEMARPDAQHLLATLALLSHRTAFSVGCYCENEARCHRSLLRDLFAAHGADVVR
jgi:uncharacterized protein YeaO (DUF488 family)